MNTRWKYESFMSQVKNNGWHTLKGIIDPTTSIQDSLEVTLTIIEEYEEKHLSLEKIVNSHVLENAAMTLRIQILETQLKELLDVLLSASKTAELAEKKTRTIRILKKRER